MLINTLEPKQFHFELQRSTLLTKTLKRCLLPTRCGNFKLWSNLESHSSQWYLGLCPITWISVTYSRPTVTEQVKAQTCQKVKINHTKVAFLHPVVMWHNCTVSHSILLLQRYLQCSKLKVFRNPLLATSLCQLVARQDNFGPQNLSFFIEGHFMSPNVKLTADHDKPTLKSIKEHSDFVCNFFSVEQSTTLQEIKRKKRNRQWWQTCKFMVEFVCHTDSSTNQAYVLLSLHWSSNWWPVHKI